jgi:Uncharacterised conserved protein.
VQRPSHDGLNRLLKLSNDTLACFGQPPLYATSLTQGKQTGLSLSDKSSSLGGEDFSACFHISLAWSLSEPSLKERERVAGVDLRALHEIQVGFDSVKAKIGNIVSSIPLGKKLHKMKFSSSKLYVVSCGHFGKNIQKPEVDYLFNLFSASDPLINRRKRNKTLVVTSLPPAEIHMRSYN